MRLPRRHAARARRPAPAATSRSRASRCRTSSPPPAPAAWCASTTTALVDRALLLRRWGRRSEVKFFGSQKGDKRFFSEIDGLEYDDLFIFDEVGWNFEPSEMSAAFGVVQMRKLPTNLARRKRNFELLTELLREAIPTCSCSRASRRASTPAGTCSRS